MIIFLLAQNLFYPEIVLQCVRGKVSRRHTDCITSS